MRNTTLAAFILAGGTMLACASFFYYWLGFSMIIEMLEKTHVVPELYRTLNLVWILTTIALFLCGVWGMFIGITIRKNLRYMRKQALILGGGMISFGIYGFLTPFPNWKLFIFLAIGLIIFIPALFLAKSKGPYF